MSEETIDEEFWKRADKFIDMANKYSEKTPIGRVSSSLAYAAARYNAFMVYANSDDAEEMEIEKETALDYFCGEFRKMLEENMNDHIQNFEKYQEAST